jgi:hypothetical protein
MTATALRLAPDLPQSLVLAVARSVETAHGDTHDLATLLDAWKRLAADSAGRVDRLRFKNRLAQAASIATAAYVDIYGGGHP